MIAGLKVAGPFVGVVVRTGCGYVKLRPFSFSMPFGQSHYPFENKRTFESNFPADFIAEGIDQTRGWFYTLLVVSTILFDNPPYKNLIINGLVLAA